jgi:hypothetical protein
VAIKMTAMATETKSRIARYEEPVVMLTNSLAMMLWCLHVIPIRWALGIMLFVTAVASVKLLIDYRRGK